MISPQITSYNWNNVSAGLTSRTIVNMQIKLSVIYKNDQIFEKTYQSGKVSQENNPFWGSIFENANRLTHKVIHQLMEQAIQDVILHLKNKSVIKN